MAGKFLKCVKKMNSEESLTSIPPNAEIQKKFLSSQQFYTVCLELPNFKSRYLMLPNRFMGVKAKEQNIILKVADRSWTVKFITYVRKSNGMFSAGWGTFIKENSLRVGDVCTFEKKRRGELKVHISRKGQ
ncbi:hypothetical protein Tsubulata_002857 [Turnera subulata]|uniref:TF-B3 domain-containing protein n=1 Tax=Turnera subulata TaxID=218843 RepID=A0A9Q0J5A5_9ROSI|nr:hypothetical protein Tsubulata_002857 [Turnera subulata]